MTGVPRILLTIVLVLIALFCTIAIIGAANLGPGETVNTGRLVLVIIGDLLAVGGLIALWRKRNRAV